MIYIDLLVIENMIINYLILLAPGILLNRITSIPKAILSSAIGCFSLVFLFELESKIFLFVIVLVFMTIMSIITYRYIDIIYTFKNIFYMFLMSIFLGGGIYLININLCLVLKPQIVNFIILVLISPLITYSYLKSLSKIKSNYSNYYKIDIYLKDKTKITLNSYLDTGNTLKDPYKRRPIILVDKNKIDITNESILLVPYNTIDSNGIIKCFKPSKIYIDKVGYRSRLLIGLIDEIGLEGADCILNKDLLERI